MAEPQDSWSEFLATTRLLHSAMLAFDRELADARTKPPKDILHWRDGKSHYRVEVDNHIDALEKRHPFFAQTLMQSWSHGERFARSAIERCYPSASAALKKKLLNMALLPATAAVSDVALEVVRKANVEAWSKVTLDLAGRSWTDVLDGEVGFYETSIVRNALVHGNTLATRRMVDSVANKGGAFPWAAGKAIELDYQTLRRFRDRIRSFGRVVAPYRRWAVKATTAPKAPKATT